MPKVQIQIWIVHGSRYYSSENNRENRAVNGKLLIVVGKEIEMDLQGLNAITTHILQHLSDLVKPT